jgi:hypothetical protein
MNMANRKNSHKEWRENSICEHGREDTMEGSSFMSLCKKKLKGVWRNICET